MWQLTLDIGSLVYILYIVGPLIAGLIICWIILRAPGKRLASDIASLGTLKGKTMKDMIKVAGPPTSAPIRTDGGQRLQWRARGFRIELLFDANGICQGASREFSLTPSVAKAIPTPAAPKIANPPSAPPPAAIGKPSMNTLEQITVAKTSTDFNRPMTVPVESPPKDQQLPHCDMCGNSLSLGAKFCDSCGNALTHQTTAPNTGIQIAPTNIQQGIIPALEPAVTVTRRNRTAEVSCENCGRELQYGDRFCDMCGALKQLNFA